MIFSGQLTETLDFYALVETPTETGFKTTKEVFLLKTKAYRLKNKESYVVDAEELFHRTELSFKFRFRKEIDETNIVVYNGNKYRITSLGKYPKENEATIILSKINE